MGSLELKTIYILVSVKDELPKEGELFVVNIAKGLTKVQFKNNHFYMDGQEVGGECYYDEFVTHWLKKQERYVFTKEEIISIIGGGYRAGANKAWTYDDYIKETIE